MSTSWLDLPADHPFGLAALPYGVFSTDDPDLRRVGVRIGDQVLDAGAAAEHAGMESGDLLDPARASTPSSPRGPHGLGRRPRVAHRACSPTTPTATRSSRTCSRSATVTMHLPFEVADYVDFYASEQHATNVGRIFRPTARRCTPNWKHLPIGYHGRAGTVVVSGTDVVRPSGQRKAPADAAPVFGPSVRLDIEAELGFVVGGATDLGTRCRRRRGRRPPLRRGPAQRLERPRHPGLGVRPARPVPRQVLRAPASPPGSLPMEALQRGPGRPARPGPRAAALPARRDARPTYGLDIHCEVRLNGTAGLDARATPTCTGRPPRCWPTSPSTAPACATATCSGRGRSAAPTPRTRGSLLELTWNGQEPLTLDDGSTRGVPRGRRHGDDHRLGARPGRHAGRPRRGHRHASCPAAGLRRQALRRAGCWPRTTLVAPDLVVQGLRGARPTAARASPGS